MPAKGRWLPTSAGPPSAFVPRALRDSFGLPFVAHSTRFLRQARSLSAWSALWICRWRYASCESFSTLNRSNSAATFPQPPSPSTAPAIIWRIYYGEAPASISSASPRPPTETTSALRISPAIKAPAPSATSSTTRPTRPIPPPTSPPSIKTLFQITATPSASSWITTWTSRPTAGRSSIFPSPRTIPSARCRCRSRAHKPIPRQAPAPPTRSNKSRKSPPTSISPKSTAPTRPSPMRCAPSAAAL